MGILSNFFGEIENVAWNIEQIPGNIANTARMVKSSFRCNASEEELKEAVKTLENHGIHHVEPGSDEALIGIIKTRLDCGLDLFGEMKDDAIRLGIVKESDLDEYGFLKKTDKDIKETSSKSNNDTKDKVGKSPFDNGGLFAYEKDGKLVFNMLHEKLDSTDPLYMEAKMCDMTLLAMVRSEVCHKYIETDDYKDWLKVKELIDCRSKKASPDDGDNSDSNESECTSKTTETVDKAETEAPTEDAGAEKVEVEKVVGEVVDDDSANNKPHFTSTEPPKPPKEEEILGNSGDTSKGASTVDNTKDEKKGGKDLKDMSKEDIKKSMMNSARNSIKRDDGESNIYKENKTSKVDK